MEVRITVTSGKITNIAVPVHPNSDARSQQINDYALPQLVQETLSAQSARIDMVSGATITSEGYLQSLQSALDQAAIR
ncbi:MAG TPA: FMN-binding protein [Microlunatus sp.]